MFFRSGSRSFTSVWACAPVGTSGLAPMAFVVGFGGLGLGGLGCGSAGAPSAPTVTYYQDVAPETECLVQTPHWDFNWQRSYVYDAAIEDLPQIRGGDTIRLRCTYDNVLTNPGVQQALEDAGRTETRVVRLGETTLDEMCLIAAGLVLPA